MKILWPWMTLLSGILAFALTSGAMAQPMSVRVAVSPYSMPPVHSYAMGEVGDWYLFFGGISGMGLHSLSGGAAPGVLPPSFPVSVYSTQIHAFNYKTGAVFSSDIAGLRRDVRRALTVTNVPGVQIGTTLYMYGGMGPVATVIGTDWDTRATVTSIDLVQVRDALIAGLPAPSSAFTVQPAPDGQVAGGIIVKMGPAGRQYALIGGSLFLGDYAGNTPFLNIYSEQAQIFDADVSITTPIQTLTSSTLHRRDMNALPMTYRDGLGGAATGFAIAGGVFQNGFFVWENPLWFRMGDSAVTDGYSFFQKMNQYDSASLCLYSVSQDENRQVLLGGISKSRYVDGQFVPDFEVPWVTDITQIRIAGGVYLDETVIGQTPLPTTNVHTALVPAIPHLPNGQILFDELPANEVLVARAPAGLRAVAPAGTPMTFASGEMYEIYITVGVRGDITRDGVVDAADLAALLGAWGTNATVPDLIFDGVINSADLATLLLLWGNNTPG